MKAIFKAITDQLKKEVAEWPKEPIKIASLGELEELVKKKPSSPIHPAFILDGSVSINILTPNCPALGGPLPYEKIMEKYSARLAGYDGEMAIWRFFPHVYVISSIDKKFYLEVGTTVEWKKVNNYLKTEIEKDLFNFYAEFMIKVKNQ